MDDFVRAQSDNLPRVDALTLAEFLNGCGKYTSVEIRHYKTKRSMRDSYVSSAVGRVALKRNGSLCTIKAEVCPEHKQRVKNYTVVMSVDEDEEAIKSLECRDCAASLGGCKHALALAMWVHTKSMAPAPTQVESYWKKPRLTNVATSRVATTSDFGVVNSDIEPDVAEFIANVETPSAPISSYKLYHTEFDGVELLDLHQLLIRFCQTQAAPYTPEEFRTFTFQAMTQTLCTTACSRTTAQSKSRLWHYLRYGRISASRLYSAAHSKTEGGGSLKELILGASKVKCTGPMLRGLNLEHEVIQQVSVRRKLRFENIGVLLSSELPEFAATPDGVSADFVVEVKCPSSEKAVRTYLKKDNTVTAKYMAQLQLQMKFSKKKKCLFCVASPSFEKNREVTIVEVDFDEAKVNSLIQQARVFWDKNIFPILLSAVS